MEFVKVTMFITIIMALRVTAVHGVWNCGTTLIDKGIWKINKCLKNGVKFIDMASFPFRLREFELPHVASNTSLKIFTCENRIKEEDMSGQNIKCLNRKMDIEMGMFYRHGDIYLKGDFKTIFGPPIYDRFFDGESPRNAFIFCGKYRGLIQSEIESGVEQKHFSWHNVTTNHCVVAEPFFLITVDCYETRIQIILSDGLDKWEILESLMLFERGTLNTHLHVRHCSEKQPKFALMTLLITYIPVCLMTLLITYIPVCLMTLLITYLPVCLMTFLYSSIRTRALRDTNKCSDKETYECGQPKRDQNVKTPSLLCGAAQKQVDEGGDQKGIVREDSEVENEATVNDDEVISDTLSPCRIVDDAANNSVREKGDVYSTRASPLAVEKQSEYGCVGQDDEILCKVCYMEEISLVFLPCSHMVSCECCSRLLRRCPVCRSVVKAMIKAEIT